MNLINVLLTGGVGSRLWPLSRKSRPKQYIPLFNGKTLFQLAAERNNNICDEILIVCNKDNYQLSEQNIKDSGITTYSKIVEATPRNTAAAVAFAALWANKEDILLVTPADHIIEDLDIYKKSVDRAVELAKEGNLVTFGIKPTKPETGYGYIQHNGEDVISFKEKPSFKDAEKYINDGNFLWNSGIFCFKAGVYLEELQKFRKDIYDSSKAAFSNIKNDFMPLDESLQIPKESIDYAVMEHSKKIKVVPSSFTWSDLGSFEALYDFYKSQGQDHLFKNNNLILSSKKHVEIIGLENIVVVETDDATLIIPRDKTQDVKNIYETLEKTKSKLIE
jgi:mannose-1-phosphate guanylyltransferase